MGPNAGEFGHRWGDTARKRPRDGSDASTSHRAAGLPADNRSWKRPGGLLSRASREGPALLTPGPQAAGLQAARQCISVVSAAAFWSVVTAAAGDESSRFSRSKWQAVMQLVFGHRHL